MKDEPLFKDADAQEAAYAPEGAEHDNSDIDEVAGAGLVIPAAGLANAGGGGIGGVGGSSGTLAAGPALAGAALADDLAPNSTDRDVPEGVNDADAQTPSG